MTYHEDDRLTRNPSMRTTATTAHGVERDADLIMAPAGWRLSWGAILAGIMVALAAHLILNLLGVGIGLGGMPRTTSADWLGTGFAIWWALAGILAAAIGGWVAGRTLGSADRNDGMIHGLLTWAGTTLVIAFLLASALGGALGMQEQVQAMYGQQLGVGAGGAPGTSGTMSGTSGATGAGGASNTTSTPSPSARSAISGAAISSFIALLLGAAAAATAGRAGVSAARRSLHND